MVTGHYRDGGKPFRRGAVHTPSPRIALQSSPLALPRRSEDRRAVLAGWRDTFLREPAPPVAVAQ